MKGRVIVAPAGVEFVLILWPEIQTVCPRPGSSSAPTPYDVSMALEEACRKALRDKT